MATSLPPRVISRSDPGTLSDPAEKPTASVRPPLQDPDVKLVYVHTHELLESLLLTVSGTSSTLHIWDPAIEKFVLRGLQGNGIGHLVIISKDEIVSARPVFSSFGNLVHAA